MQVPLPKPSSYNFDSTSMYNVPEKIQIHLHTEKINNNINQNLLQFINQYQHPIKIYRSSILVKR